MAQDSTVSLSVITPVSQRRAFRRVVPRERRCSAVRGLGAPGRRRWVERRDGDDRPRPHDAHRVDSLDFQEPGANQSRALNIGVQESRGRILGVLNVDDYYEPDTLSRVIELFRDRPSPTFAAANCNAWKDGVLLFVNRPRELRFEKLLLGPDIYPFPFNPAAYFYDKSLHDVIGPYDVDDELSNGPSTSSCARSELRARSKSTRRRETSAFTPRRRR